MTFTTKEYRVTSFTGFDALKLQESSIPKLRSSEVLVKIHAVSLQYRDLIVTKNLYPLGAKDNVLPCSDGAGEIIEVGEGVKGWKKGDRVCANFNRDHIAGDITLEARSTGHGGRLDGMLTQYKVLPAHCLVSIPSHLSFEEASTLPCAAVTAYNALFGSTPVKAGDYVLVQGTGGVAIFALQFAVASGAVVIITSSSDEKLLKAKQLGATHVINYEKKPEWDKEVLKMTGDRGVDHIIEIGGPGTVMQSLNCVRFGGMVHLIGFMVLDPSNETGVTMACLGKAAYLRGILVGSRHQFEDMNRLITTCKLRPVIDKSFSFQQVREAYEYLDSRKHVGKVTINVSGN